MSPEKSIHLKVVVLMTLLIAAGITASLAIAAYLPKATVVPVITDPIEAAKAAFADTTTFPAKLFTLEEGYSIQLVDGWELFSHTPERRVDRYRFERASGGHIFTISIYDRQQSPTFDAVIQARYGASALRDQMDVEISGLTAKRLTADFLDMGSTTDVVVEVNANTFLSLYGVRQLSADANLQVAKEINFMQKSFKQ